MSQLVRIQAPCQHRPLEPKEHVPDSTGANGSSPDNEPDPWTEADHCIITSIQHNLQKERGRINARPAIIHGVTGTITVETWRLLLR